MPTQQKPDERILPTNTPVALLAISITIPAVTLAALCNTALGNPHEFEEGFAVAMMGEGAAYSDLQS